MRGKRRKRHVEQKRGEGGRNHKTTLKRGENASKQRGGEKNIMLIILTSKEANEKKK
jgi:hypothetical protein